MTERIKNGRKNLKEGGVTLVALVITIIVLLILAGVALATLTGDSGILSNSENAKEETLKANVKEKLQLAIMEYKVGQYTEGKTLKEYLELAGATEVTEAGTKGKMDGYNFEIENGVVTVTKSTTEVTGKVKLKDVYTEEMIGQTINYTTTNALPSDVEWIIIGQDEEGNVLATTNRPLGVDETESDYLFNMTFNVSLWLTYEEDLNKKCAELFAGSIQNQNVKVESMDLDHVNLVTGFEVPEFNTYTFKDQADNDYANKIVNYYHPDATSENNWSKNTATYNNDYYYYCVYGEDVYYEWEGIGNAEKYTKSLKNLDLILGKNNEFNYVLASKSVDLGSVGANFGFARVGGVGGVYSHGDYFCYANSSNFADVIHSESNSIRPIIYLSSEFVVEENEDGTYRLAENV